MIVLAIHSIPETFPKSFAAISVVGRAFALLLRASRSVFAYIVCIFLAPSSAFEARLVGKSKHTDVRFHLSFECSCKARLKVCI